MTTDEMRLRGNMPPQVVVVTTPITTLPFNVMTELNPYTRIYVALEYDFFKIVHCYENHFHDYKVYGEMSDGDKKLLFTVSQHFQCKACCDCDGCGCVFQGCCECICSDKIIFQLDYRRNNVGFYTQGLYIQKGCRPLCCQRKKGCCEECAEDCCPQSILYLRENIDPDNPDFNVGVRKGQTISRLGCCGDRTSTYYPQEGGQSYRLKAKCCDIRERNCKKHCFNMDSDFEIDIEDGTGLKTGNVMLYSGMYSSKVEGRCCFLPRPYFEVNLPAGATSEQKFHIIADLIHLDVTNRIL